MVWHAEVQAISYFRRCSRRSMVVWDHELLILLSARCGESSNTATRIATGVPMSVGTVE